MQTLSSADTKAKLIDPALHSIGWIEDIIRCEESASHRIIAELKEKMAYVEKLQSAIRNQQSAINALPQAILRKAFRGEL